MSVQGVDVSAYQQTIDYKALAATPFGGFVFAKATEGTDYTDDYFRANHNGAKAAGIPFGAYHFLHFGQDPIAQAQAFLAAIDGYEGTLLPMVDVESGGLDGVTNLDTLIAGLSMFLKTVEATLGGKRCIIYSDWNDWNTMMGGTSDFSGHPFWIAAYNNDAAPPIPNGVVTWVLWQYTSGGTVNGIPGFVDCDLLNGNDTGVISR